MNNGGKLTIDNGLDYTNSSMTYTIEGIDIKIYSDPNCKLLYIEGELSNKNIYVVLKNILGKPLLFKEAIDDKTVFDLSSFPAGPYFLEFSINHTKLIKKIVVA